MSCEDWDSLENCGFCWLAVKAEINANEAVFIYMFTGCGLSRSCVKSTMYEPGFLRRPTMWLLVEEDMRNAEAICGIYSLTLGGSESR